MKNIDQCNYLRVISLLLRYVENLKGQSYNQNKERDTNKRKLNKRKNMRKPTLNSCYI